MDKQTIPRHKEKYPALNFKRQVKLRRDYFEGIEEYVDQLSDKEKEWLNSFLEETVVTNFNHKGKKLYKSKKSKREFYNANNARNRCTFTKAKAMGMLDSLEGTNAVEATLSYKDYYSSASDVEDMFIEAVSLKRSGVIEEQNLEADSNEEANAEMLRYLLETGQIKESSLAKKK